MDNDNKPKEKEITKRVELVKPIKLVVDLTPNIRLAESLEPKGKSTLMDLLKDIERPRKSEPLN